MSNEDTTSRAASPQAGDARENQEPSSFRVDPPAVTRKPMKRRPAVDSAKQRQLEAQCEQQARAWLQVFAPAGPVIVIPVIDRPEDVAQCLEALVAHTPEDVPVLLLTPADAEAITLPDGGRFLQVVLPAVTGYARSLNLASDWCAPRDIVVVASDAIVPPRWLPRLQSAARYRTNIATATPLTNDGAFLSVPDRNRPGGNLPNGMTTEQVDARIEAESRRRYPLIPTPIPHCIYYNRWALNVVGTFNESAACRGAEEIDFAQRAVMAGFSHVAADDLFVSVRTTRMVRNWQSTAQTARTARTLNTRYPWYQPWLEASMRAARSPLALALGQARIAVSGYRIAFDARSLDRVTNGTEVVTLELLRALVTHPAWTGHLAVILKDGVSPRVLGDVEPLINEFITVSDAEHYTVPPFDLVHRPFQIPWIGELSFLRKIAPRFAITHLDSIAFANPSYATDADAWAHLQRAMGLSFAYADGVAFLSRDAAEDAAHQGLAIPEERTCITYSGVDHHLLSHASTPPPESVAFAEHPFFVVIGTNYRHKNRLFALHLLRLLQALYGWQGHLVFAGIDTRHAGSRGNEATELLHTPDIRAFVHDLGAVNEQEKRWLYDHAALVLYPSVYEGFGLIPFEAAAAGTPALAFRTTSVLEVLGNDVAYLDALDSVASAETAWTMITEPQRAEAQVQAIRERATRFTWRAVADRVIDFYHHLLTLPPRSPAIDVVEEVEHDLHAAEHERVAGQRVVSEVWRDLGETKNWAQDALGYAQGIEKWAADILAHAERTQTWNEGLQEHTRNLEVQLEAAQQHAERTQTWGEGLQEHTRNLEVQLEAAQQHAERTQTWGEGLQEHTQNLEQWAHDLEAQLHDARHKLDAPQRGEADEEENSLSGNAAAPVTETAL